MRRIHLRIDRLILNGLQPDQDKVLVETLRAQLSQILSDGTLCAAWTRSHRTEVLKLGRVPIDAGPAGARKFGALVARGIRRGLETVS